MPGPRPTWGWATHGVWLAGAAVVGLVPLFAVLWVGPLLVVLLVLPPLLALALGSPFWAVALFLLALPVGLNEGLLPTGPVDLVQLLAAFVVAAVVMQRILTGRAPLRWHRSAGWAVGLAVMVVVAAVTARDVTAAIAPMVLLAVAVALSLAVQAACPSWSTLRWLVVILAVVGAGVCLYSLGGAGDMQATVAGAGAVENRALGVFQSPNQLGSFSGLLLFVGLGLALGARTRLERVVGGLCAAAAAAALLITLSRGAWIGAAVALVVLLAMSRRARRAVPVVIGAAVVIVPIALTVAAPQLLEVLVDRAAALVELDANPEDARPLIYQEAVRQIVERPWTGQGPANYAIVLESAESSAPGVDVVHAHNVLLQVAAETGIPSAVLLVAFTLSMARQVLQARSRLQAPEQDVLAGLACGLVVLVGQGFADFTLGNPTLLFLAWTVVGFLFAATTLPGPGEPDPAPSSGDGRLEVGRTVVGVRPAEPAPV